MSSTLTAAEPPALSFLLRKRQDYPVLQVAKNSIKTTSNGYLAIQPLDFFLELEENKKKEILEKIGRTYCSVNKFIGLEDKKKDFYISIGALAYEQDRDGFELLISEAAADFFARQAPTVSYMGQARIAKIVEEYLGPSEIQLAQKKDHVESLLTLVDENTASLKNPLDIFWALAKDFWYQIIDGKYIYINNPLVFDLGLHPLGQKEPGFYKSMLNACRFATMHFNDFPSVEYYKLLHSYLCAHFPLERREQNAYGVLMSAKETGIFRRRRNVGCTATISEFYSLNKNELFNKYHDWLYTIFTSEEFIKNSLSWEKLDLEIKIKFKNPKNYEDFLINAKAIIKLVDDKISEINDYIKKRSLELEVDAIATIARNGFELTIYYSLPPKQIPLAVENLFKQFEKAMAKADTKDKKISCIAGLFQILEWIHPFHDGQGRADLVLLSTLLAKNGINPPILTEPYFSSTSNFEDWIEYLKEGITNWQYMYRIIKAGF